MSDVATRVTAWLAHAGRQMAWRDTRDPYQIWLAEVILQQTRIETGIAYLERFLARFPRLEDLARAELDEVLKLWEGLGYYSRARNLHAASKQLMEEHAGEFPRGHRALLALKGIGPYTARAISSFAYDEKVAVLDGNVMRVLSRLIGDFSPIDQAATRNKFQAQLDAWVQEADSRAFNHAMMDIGSIVCTPTSPGCLICPLEPICVARREGLTQLLPIKGKKLLRKIRFFHFYLLDDGASILLRRRPNEGLWGGLWELPNEEVEEANWKAKLGRVQSVWLGQGKHVFTHFDMHYHVFSSPADQAVQWTDTSFERYEKIPTFAFSKAVINMLTQHHPTLL